MDRTALPYTIKSFSVIIETNINRFVEQLVENELTIRGSSVCRSEPKLFCIENIVSLN